jgi:hypothetical protein
VRRRFAHGLLAVAAILVALCGISLLLQRQVLDEAGFVANVDQLRQDPAVAHAVGDQVADAAVAHRPDLVAIKPLIAQVATAVVASSAAGPIFRVAATQAHATLTEPGSDQVVLRLADLGAVVTALLPVVSPEAADAIPPDLPVTLATIGGQGGPIAAAVRYAHLAEVLTWVLLALTAGCLAGAVLIHPRRRRAGVEAGLAVAAGGLLLLGIALVAQVWAASLDPSTTSGLVCRALWTSFGRPLFAVATLVLLLGGMVVVAASSALPTAAIESRFRAAVRWLTHRPSSTTQAVARASAFGGLGLALVLWTEPMLRVLGTLAGVGALLYFLLEVCRLSAGRQRSREAVLPAGTVVRPAPLALGAVGVVLVAWLLAARSGPDLPAGSGIEASGTGCNGHVELCDRRYDEVAFAAAHNAMSAEDAGFYLAEQPTGMVGLLDQGVRVLLVDTWYGQPVAGGRAITAKQSFSAAAKQAEQDFGPEVVQSVNRLVTQIQASVGPTTGPVQPYLCHTFCEIGGTPLLPALQGVRAWLQAHPREVVSLFIQDTVSPADTAKALDAAGLTPQAYVPGGVDAPWPTLGSMIDTGKRLVVLMEHQGGGTTYPFLLQGFDYVQDTGYSYPTAASFDCALNRGAATSPLFMVNHWLNNFSHLVSDSKEVNTFTVLDARMQACLAERGRKPNFVAVNWVNLGALNQVVDKLNGF